MCVCPGVPHLVSIFLIARMTRAAAAPPARLTSGCCAPAAGGASKPSSARCQPSSAS
uniref:Uncharacterized protein n=1 Tax=Siphoviridae sp. ctvGX2 TaxID=2826512 RepID=A0A8S5LZE5_9CAUD|nr:MAG TPA: hypothetical protein [Siphoviridae sp. ctvGX2]